jgi:hypothetical protein
MNTTSHESSVATSLSINSFEERLSDLNIAIDSYMKSYSDKDIVQKLRNQISNDTTNNRFARSIVYDYYREKEEETSRVKGLDDVKNKYSNIKYLTVIGVLLRKAFPRHTGKYKDEMSKDYKILKRLLFDDTIQMNRTSMIKLRDLAISKKLPLKVSSEYKDEFVEGYHTYEMTTDNFSREFYKKRQSSDYMPKGRLDIEFVAKTKNTSVFNEGAEEPEEDIGPLRKFVQDIGTEAQYILDRLLLNKDLFIGNGRGVNTKPSEVEVLNSNAKLFMSCLKNKGEVLANQIFKQSVKYKTWKGLEEGEFFSQRSHVECNSEFQFNLVTQFLLARLIPYLTDEEKSLVYQKIVLGEEIDFNESFNLLEK